MVLNIDVMTFQVPLQILSSVLLQECQKILPPEPKKKNRCVQNFNFNTRSIRNEYKCSFRDQTLRSQSQLLRTPVDCHSSGDLFSCYM